MLASFIILSVILVPCTFCTASVDYPGIGSFNTAGRLDSLPVDPYTIIPTFNLYTRENPTEPEFLRWNDTESIKNSQYFSGARPTKMIIHGFVEKPSTRPWMGAMKDAFLASADLNVIILDWSTNSANRGRYGQVAANTQVVGPMVAIQIRLISQLKNTAESQFHLLGQSLGAHVAGFAGKFLNGSLGQITGMDPAGPSFEGAAPEARLWFTDALFVDAIHTDIKPVIGLGMEEPCGHIDLYPNGGRHQPGCGAERWSAFWKGFGTGARTLVGCEHYRSWAYYIESITNSTNDKLLAHRCENYELFESGNCYDCGEDGRSCVRFGPRAVEFNPKGENRIKFYIDTSDHEPYFQ